MSTSTPTGILQPDIELKGHITGAKHLVVNGRVEGTVEGSKVIVGPTGNITGTLRADTAEISGTVEGEARIKHLIQIRSTGTVAGDVEYGQLAMEPGGSLEATVRNVPPTLSGDHDLTVARSGTVAITTADLAAIDPDDAAKDLVFTVSRAHGGRVAFKGAPDRAAPMFTLADLTGGKVVFAHDGSPGTSAGFHVVVADAKGAKSGDPQPVRITVTG